PAVGVRLRQCTAVRNVSLRNVLEADNRSRRICWIVGRYGRRGRDAWFNLGRREGWLAGYRPAHLPLDHGAKFLDRDLRLVHLFSGYSSGELAVGAQGGGRAS